MAREKIKRLDRRQEAVFLGLIVAETGMFHGDPLSPERWIRTRLVAGNPEIANSENLPTSSAWGPLQITWSLASGALKNGWFAEYPKVEVWVRERFIPHGKRLARSPWNHHIYGAGKPGDIGRHEWGNYLSMAILMLQKIYEENKRDIYEVVGEWRLGKNKRKALMEEDPAYWGRFAREFVRHI